MTLTGSCHCRSIQYELEWPGISGAIPARRCGCSYCARFNGTWTSHPDARLSIKGVKPSAGRAYRFGTETADFLFCGNCGVTIAALCETGGSLRAVLNVNTLDDSSLSLDASDSDFDGETPEQRLDRRKERWIGHVSLEDCLQQ